MPPVAAAVGAAVSSWAASITIGSIVSSIASSLVLSGLQRLLTPKPKSQGVSIQNSGITTQVRQPIMVRKPTYGEMRRSGGVLFLGMTENNKYLHMVIEVAPHEVNEIGEVWLNDYSIPEDWIDVDGNVIDGRYSGLVRIRKILGSDSQSADAFMVSEITEWTSNHRLRGIAYLYVRLQWDQDKFPTGVPNVSAWIRGKSVYDPRSGFTGYNNNVALILNDYLLDTEYGLGTTSIDSTFLTAAANVCDEFVTVTDYAVSMTAVSASADLITLSGDKLYYQRGDRVQLTTTGTLPAGLSLATDYYVIPYQRKDTCRIRLATTYENALNNVYIDITDAGSGTHTVTKKAEPRYSGAVTIDTEQEVGENVKDILSGMAGFLTYSGGQYRMIAGAYQTPTVYFDEGNIVSAISIQTKISKRERFNTVRGTYISPINDGQPSDYPQITNSTYVSEDGESIVRQIDMPLTQRAHTAQRIAKINLELSRQEISWSADFDLSALQVVAGENAYFTIDRMGWSDKVFQIETWRIEFREEENTVRPVVRMKMREIASANYDWNNGEETLVDPAPNSNLPDPFTVAPITNFAIGSEFVETQQNDLVFKVVAQWDQSSDEFVANGGYYELQYKRSNVSTWRPTYTVPGNFTFAEVTLAAQLNEDYDLRIRAVNSLNVRSDYAYIYGYFVGTSGAVTSTEDWGTFSESVGTTDDWQTFTDSVTITKDWGFYT